MNAETCAREVMDFVLQTMRLIRAEMRGYCGDQLSVPQFRTLSYIYKNPGASLSDVATHLGVTLPTMSRIVDKLVERQLVAREGDPENRRRLILHLMPEGKRLFEAAMDHTLKQLAQRLGKRFTPDQLALIGKTIVELGEALKPGLP